MHTRIKQLAAVVFVGALSSAANVDAQRGVSPRTLSLPSGPGSVEGLGSSFEPSPQSGGASYSVPFAMPQAVGGFAPSLSLGYAAGGGATEVGHGWSLPIPSIRVRTEDGIPRYDATDTFAIAGGGGDGDLVPMGAGVFRLRFEGSFIRVRRDGQRWQVRQPDGITHWFGEDASARDGETERTSRWLITRSTDRHGHAIRYEYARDGNRGFLSTIRYGGEGAAEVKVELGYEARPDVLVSYQSGDPITLNKRLTTVRLTRGGELVATYALRYASDAGLSRLESVTMTGTDGTTALPTLRFQYGTVDFSAMRVATVANAPGMGLQSAANELVDLNGDGAADLLVTAPGRYLGYLNEAGERFGAQYTLDVAPSVSLDQAGVQVADMDGDASIDIVAKVGVASDGFRFYPGGDARSFGAVRAFSSNRSYTFEDPEVRLVDLDFDRRTDVLFSTPSGLYASYNTGGDFTAPEALPTVDPAQPVRFNDAAIRLADINGDRLQDLVHLRSGSLVYWPSRGRGRYAAAQTMTGVPTVPDASALQLVDLTGDGLTDLVRVGVNVVEAWIHQANGSFSAMPRMVAGVPERGPNTSVRFIDMNGNGSTDIVWVDVTGSPATAWRYLDVLSAAAPNQLTQIDNGLGLVTSIRYRASAAFAADDARAGRPWTTRLPNGMLVVSEIVEDVGLGVLETTRFNYHDGLYHGLTREFRGFGRAEKIEVGDEQQPTLVSALEFDHGVTDEARKGMLLRSERRTEGGAVFDRTTSTIEVVNAGMGMGGVALRWARPRRSETAVYEQTMTPKTTRSETDYDAWGNVIETRELGLVEGDDVTVGNDERVTRMTYAINEDEWLLRYLASTEVVDLAGTRASMSRQYYDGDAFTGLAHGQVARGNVTRQEAWRGPGPSDWIPQGGNQYDRDGNVTETRDGDGRVRRIEWDPTTHAYPVTERAIVREGRELVWTATYDHRFGRVVTATGPDGTTNRYTYDVLGRVAATWVAASESGPPTMRYGYVLSAPLSRVEVAELVAHGSNEYRTRVTLMDASGRARASIDPGPEGRAIVKTIEELGPRGWTKRTFHPFESTTTGPALLSQGEWVSSSQYDALGRQVATTFVDGARSETHFAPFQVTEFDPSDLETGSPREGRPEITRRNGLGQIVSNVVELPSGSDVTSMRYDVLGNVIQRTDPLGLVQSWRFDGLARRTEVNDPNGGRRSAEYDNAGNLVRWRSARGHLLTARYDGVGRLVARDADGDGTEEISYEFDDGCENGAGRLCAIREPNWTVLTDYDRRGSPVRSEFGALGQRWEIRESFGPMGELLRHTFPDASSLDLQYDGAGRVASAGDLIRAVRYNARGDVERIEYGNGVLEVREFDVRGRPKAVKYTDRNGAVLEDIEYRFDATTTLREVIDRRAGRTPSDDRSERYQHDARGHLIEANGTWGWMRWQYDAADRLLERTSSVAALHLGTISYGPMNQRQPYAPRQMGTTRLEWDEAGNVANIDGAAARFNARDLPELIPLPNNGRMESVFDGNGMRRIERVRGERESTTVQLTAFEHIRDGKLIRTIPLGGRTIWVSDEGVARQDTRGCDSRPSPREGTTHAWPLLWLLLVLPAERIRKQRRSVSTIAVTAALLSLGCMAVPGARALRTDEGKVVLSGIDGSTLGTLVDVATTYVRQLRYPGGFPRAEIAIGEFSVYSGSQRTTHPDVAAIGPRVLNVRLGIWLSVDSA
ncbi:MAG: toxin TcdB middle/N-terminal domain-containing protein, partial [Deltaproteobacteria bacterium]|nr:toxin TcdB middle/N-terminal domain-containing protein [Deltaproteobacteria bacterium]